MRVEIVWRPAGWDTTKTLYAELDQAAIDEINRVRSEHPSRSLRVPCSLTAHGHGEEWVLCGAGILDVRKVA